MLPAELTFISCRDTPVLCGQQAGHLTDNMLLRQALMEQLLSGTPGLELNCSRTGTITQLFAQYHGHQMDNPLPQEAMTALCRSGMLLQVLCYAPTKVILHSFAAWHGLMMDRASSRGQRIIQHRYGILLQGIPFLLIAATPGQCLMHSGLLTIHALSLEVLI